MVFPPGLGQTPGLRLLAPGSEVSPGKHCCGHHQLCRQLPILVTGLLNPDWSWQLPGILHCQLPSWPIHLFPPRTYKSPSTGVALPAPSPSSALPRFPPPGVIPAWALKVSRLVGIAKKVCEVLLLSQFAFPKAPGVLSPAPLQKSP